MSPRIVYALCSVDRRNAAVGMIDVGCLCKVVSSVKRVLVTTGFGSSCVGMFYTLSACIIVLEVISVSHSLISSQSSHLSIQQGIASVMLLMTCCILAAEICTRIAFAGSVTGKRHAAEYMPNTDIYFHVRLLLYRSRFSCTMACTGLVGSYYAQCHVCSLLSMDE